ncbi:MAG: hypothetical protein A3I54_01685 [Candidatus Levybacteria bacterium RIFCSPLOWO2_02_FULL_41_11]|nr:MAG: hypothetical protein A3E43_01140 [Candidatus Levybacteria bacterium RIFCSPHIGHO2_12_FULL_40_31]OGH49340.1 MAG: hypothetical protein A3I54_01685 [Candidatus Levybacteria bacterium RIFCSPLOWO2_02_FULL_41_11]OGH53833.1 MAG: hypothetical protein A3G15_01710 [Candidatus Levybacteria bacterium RIFCSPLOWO2_12_FULL_40_10]
MLAYIKRIITFSLIASFLLLTVGLLKTAEAQVHNRPSSNIDLAPAPTSPGDNFEYYSDPTTITISATADTGYTVDAIYYKLDGGPQQEYTAPISVTGTGNHGIEYWAVDNSGIEEYPHKSKSFIINVQPGTINYIEQNTQTGNTLNVSVNFENFDEYESHFYSSDCYNDNGVDFRLYNADTGQIVVSRTGYSHCGNLGDGNNWLDFPPVVLPTGNYFIYYHGSTGQNWITNTYSYTASVPHDQPTTTSSLSPSPSSPGNGLSIYTDPVTVTLNATADSGYSIDTTYYTVDGGATQTYSGPFDVTGSKSHSIEYWSVDNTGLAETTHKFNSFMIEPYSAEISSITQNSTTIDLSLTFTNFSNYTAPLYSQDCYNDNGASFKLYNADTGAVVSSQSGYSHCGGASDGSNNWLGFPPLQLSTGNYFVYYHGGNGDNWITNNFSYTEPVPVHEEPVSSVNLSPSPATPGDGLSIYSDPVTLTISSIADTGYTIDTIYYKLDGGAQQVYTSPITVIGTGSHGIEYWAVDNTGLEESPHKFKSMIVDPKNAVINDIVQGGVTVTANITFDDFAEYQYPFYSHDCYNDNNAAFEIYNALTGEKVSYQTGYSHCLGLVDPSYAILIFPPLQLPHGTYFVHYHGGDGTEWVSDNFEYIPNESPTANAGSDQTVTEGDTVQFDGSGSTDPDGVVDIVSYDWTFGDGETGTGISPTHVYDDAGVYTATLTVEDSQGETDSDTVTITVNEAQPIEITLTPTDDTYIKNGQDNRNEGGDVFMRVRSSGNNRALVSFEQTEIENAVGSGTILEAKVVLTITDNGNNWGTGRTVDIHRLTSGWTEGNGTENDRGTGSGTTWNCATDSDISNQGKDCSGASEWEMGKPNQPELHPWIETPTDTITITSGLTGEIEYDVTSDVQAFLSGSESNFGWLIRKTEEEQNGRVEFGTKESSYTPQLVITYQP